MTLHFLTICNEYLSCRVLVDLVYKAEELLGSSGKEDRKQKGRAVMAGVDLTLIYKLVIVRKMSWHLRGIA